MIGPGKTQTISNSASFGPQDWQPSAGQASPTQRNRPLELANGTAEGVPNPLWLLKLPPPASDSRPHSPFVVAQSNLMGPNPSPSWSCLTLSCRLWLLRQSLDGSSNSSSSLSMHQRGEAPLLQQPAPAATQGGLLRGNDLCATRQKPSQGSGEQQ